jgi:hypothetical protein
MMFSILIRPLAAVPDRSPSVSGGLPAHRATALRKLIQRVLMIDRRGTP